MAATAFSFHINQRLSYAGSLCTVRYIGPVEGTSGEWIGVEWDEPARGKHSGEHGGKKYFNCIIPNASSFIRPSRTPDQPLSFVQALRKKYIDAGEHAIGGSVKRPIEWGGKVVEEVGFEKIREKLRKLKELRTIHVDGLQIERGDDEQLIEETCPNIDELDLARNLFERIDTIEGICRHLTHLRSLRISGNRLSSFDLDLKGSEESGFSKVITLDLEEMLISWEELAVLIPHLPSVQNLDLDLNRFTSVSPVILGKPISSIFPPSLQKIKLEKNKFTSLSAVFPLMTLPNLRRLILAHNQISKITEVEEDTSEDQFPGIVHLDLSFNAIASFTFLDRLSIMFPKLEGLRITHNPLYQTPGMGQDEGHMLTVGRLGWNVRTLNYSTISMQERNNAELYYLSKISKEMAEVPEGEMDIVKARHPRWAELCKLHGEPIVNRASESERKTLGANLISLKITHSLAGKSFEKEIPKSTTISVLKAIAGRLFDEKPFKIKLKLQAPGTVKEALALDDEFRRLDFYVEDKREAELLVLAT